MKMPYEYVDVIDGNIRLRCTSNEAVEAWTQYILGAGRIPKYEPGPIILKQAA